MTANWIDEAVARWHRAGIVTERGLKDAELAAAEAAYNICFPPDLRQLLQAALPTGPGWPNWRDLNSEYVRNRLGWPLDGMLFDIEHTVFWMQAWGERPDDLADAFEIARQAVASAPRLVPIYVHRYIPCDPCVAGQPVISVYQTDIIYYGSNLSDYLWREFSPASEQRQLTPFPSEPAHVAFWSDVIDHWQNS